MNTLSHIIHFALACVVLALAACGGGEGVGDGSDDTNPSRSAARAG